MAVHDLKCWPNYFDAVQSGEKTFQVRRDDRGFQKGDVLQLYKFAPGNGYVRDPITGKTIFLLRRVTWILTGGQFGVEPGYVVMGLKDETQ